MSRETLCAQQGLLGLNEDVLLEIVSHLDAASAHKLSATARSIHPLARRQALSTVTIDDVHGDLNYQKITGMCTYMLHDIPGRLHCVKSLKIRVGLPKEHYISWMYQFGETFVTAGQKLAQFLENAIQLQSLEVYLFDEIIALEPRIASAIHALPNFRRLDITVLGISTCVQEFLLTMRHDLQKLRIIDLTSGLSEHQVLPNLINMKITDLELPLSKELDPDHSSNNGYQHSFPDMRKLSLPLLYTGISMYTLWRAFPNLRALRIHDCVRFNSAENACWKSLDYVEGPVELFEQWSPTCHVPHVSISSILARPHFDISPSGIYGLKTALRLFKQTSPLALSFSIMADPGLAESFWMPLVECAPRLRSLEVKLHPFSEGDMTPGLFACIRVISAALGRMPTVIHLRLLVMYPRRRISAQIDQREELALQLLEEAPSIRYVSVSLAGGLSYLTPVVKSAAWKVVGARTCRKLEHITESFEEDVRSRIIAPDFDPRSNL
ncbi:hypothetical protein POSPLADRAFT_1058851 [Postia placenta MAD-698-R-SB12]|uniref:F-box domain-containing protein n=1 Tax=Postia placenta MAD-698-R-SB12 TaxID=670580 RepID=A0A1X6MWD4_9APHY|nr:hypothetical protein POSPLADRAFT_1058851 [Postia placenta MAD-698-R-SB12]OSX60678.1 hypothetical protein POSPLADRAFT_1058851 [Postia placenta MAD-698-R-SB12]